MRQLEYVSDPGAPVPPARRSGETGAYAALRGAGLRVTALRATLLEVAATAPHLDVDALWQEVGERLGSVSKQAVYDSLEVLAAAGLVRRIQPAFSPARYEARTGDNHHHVVCRSCGRAADVDCAIGAAPCLEPSSTGGYEIDEAEVIFWGRCPACLAAAGQPGAGQPTPGATDRPSGPTERTGTT